MSALKVKTGDSVLTRDLVWCECGRGLSISGAWLYCPSCGGELDQDSYHAAVDQAKTNGASRFYRDPEMVEELVALKKSMDLSQLTYAQMSDSIRKIRDEVQERNFVDVNSYTPYLDEAIAALLEMSATEIWNQTSKPGPPEPAPSQHLVAIDDESRLTEAKRRLRDPLLAQVCAELYGIVDLAMQCGESLINAFGVVVCQRIGYLLYRDSKLERPEEDYLEHIATEANFADNIPETEHSIS